MFLFVCFFITWGIGEFKCLGVVVVFDPNEIPWQALRLLCILRVFNCAHTICDIHWLPVTDKHCLWKTLTLCDKRTLSLIDNDCLRQTWTVRDKQRISMTDFLWVLQGFFDRQRVYLQCVCPKLPKRYLHSFTANI